MLQKMLITATIVFLGMTSAIAQRFAYVDVNQVLETIEEYRNAQTQLDNVAATWRQDISKEYDQVKSMYNRYQAEQVLLSDEERKQREEEIMEKEKAIRELQKAKFGPDGELFQRRKELVAPIQDKVYAAIESYAGEKGYDFILDKSSMNGLLFANPEYDKTNDILKALARK